MVGEAVGSVAATEVEMVGVKEAREVAEEEVARSNT